MVLGRIDVKRLAGITLLGCIFWMMVVTPAAAPTPMGALGMSQKPLRGYRICIDPGHGGQSIHETRYTGGTFGAATRQTESDVNLRVSLMLAQYLEEAGATIILTRTTDNRVQDKPDMASELDARSRYANSRRADLFISMHHNHGPRGVNYTAVFYHRNSPESGKLADQISASLAFCMGTPNIGARSSAYRVLRDLKMPGVIVECSFMTNPSEDTRLANLSYNKLQAKGVAIGIINYVRQTKGRGVDFTTVFGPLDEMGNRTQVVADSTYRGDGPPPSVPFFQRQNQAPSDAAATAVATAPAMGASANSSDVADAWSSLESPEPGLSPLPSGAPTRLESIRQSAAENPSRSNTSSRASRSMASAGASRPGASNGSASRPSTSNSASRTNTAQPANRRNGSSATSARAGGNASGSTNAVRRTASASTTAGRATHSRPAQGATRSSGASSASRPVSTQKRPSAPSPSSRATVPGQVVARSAGASSVPVTRPSSGSASVSYSRRQ